MLHSLLVRGRPLLGCSRPRRRPRRRGPHRLRGPGGGCHPGRRAAGFRGGRGRRRMGSLGRRGRLSAAAGGMPGVERRVGHLRRVATGRVSGGWVSGGRRRMISANRSSASRVISTHHMVGVAGAAALMARRFGVGVRGRDAFAAEVAGGGCPADGRMAAARNSGLVLAAC
jgi:hypothetical protein